jgi:hypothetical protein
MKNYPGDEDPTTPDIAGILELTLTFPFKAFGRDSFLNDIRSQDHFL